ncbi:hypothetical protein [Alkalihalobacillus sp. BA299]|uniref:hypothetical protein n=1 Tax=Alkalihalobacillus sp. BA299 TaxID=2815938 RepID=UPI001ADB101B|nr:hypothetical protein [Alkalihalobacillus sp. BA299]
MEHKLRILDELEDEFTSNDFSIIKDIIKGIEETDGSKEFDIKYWKEAIDEIYDEVYLSNRKQGLRNTVMYGSNDVQSHFVFYSLYKLVSDESKALKQAELAHKYYIKNTLSYQWENLVYKALRELYGEAIVSDCVLPNDKRPDLVINPTYNKIKFHSKGSRILKADKIIDMKTSIYHASKENRYYKEYCQELIIVYILDYKNKKDKDITYVSAEDLKESISDKKIINEITAIQKKMKINFLINDFDKRLKL